MSRSSRPSWLPVTATAATRRPDAVPDSTRALVLARAGGCCESCGAGLVLSSYSIHHRRPLGSGGSRAADRHSPCNLLALCGSGTSGCHGAVHANRTHARDAGLLVRQSANPARVAVQLHGGRRVLLTAAGSYAPEEAS
ncbi:HNH endonuclease [Parafrankia sp. EUN1f]|uniref:HNH endonuclease n=1 Tax=Parafrankia sp. EUN1f TaxID=102897 RepID=UPI0001C45245|nr:HNH endonuclease signature motif containing protein [Parafrankia sp. EUN1f]EFC79170.1 hypothetical protein FrEUN1fDRAFT_7701 [Parafrankia sp. EUN1f]